MVEEVKAASHGDWEPQYFYDCETESSVLKRRSLETGMESTIVIPNYTFRLQPMFCEVPGEKLYVIGGSPKYVSGDQSSDQENYADCIDLTTLEFSVIAPPPIRHGTTTYHDNYIYLSGYEGVFRLILSEGRWETLISGTGRQNMAVVKLGNGIYHFGGKIYYDEWTNEITRLDLSTLAFEPVLTFLYAQDFEFTTYFTVPEYPNELFWISNDLLSAFNVVDGTTRPAQQIRSDHGAGGGLGLYRNGFLYCKASYNLPTVRLALPL
jgi:hypothetical protein